MKNVIQLCVILMTAIMFLASCGSSLSVTKRQHSKGYFVTSNKNYSSPPEKEKVDLKRESAPNQAVAEVKETKKTTQLQDDYSKTNTNLGVDKNKTSTTKLKKESYSDLTSTNSLTDKKIEQSKDDQPRTIKTAINKVNSTVASSQSRSQGQGLSLLWIIIIVLLILWALGLIGGLGSSGLLHLLLVIALILLILWLLRII